MHAEPSIARHEPLPLQTLDPEHSLSGSVPPAMLPHVPSAPLPFLAAVHAWHVPVHAVLQQTPSAQLPLWHSALSVHANPFENVRQEPLPLQAVEPTHSLSGSAPLMMLPQNPSAPLPFFDAEHAWHDPLQAVSQHTLSTQKLLAHSELAKQSDPRGN